MIAKFAVLLFASACLAYPADEAPAPVPPQAIPEPQAPQGIPPPQGIPEPQSVPVPQNIPVPYPEGQQPEGQLQAGPVAPQGTPGGKPENSDLKTDNTFWYRRSYYHPVVYRRSYYPRSYSYYPSYYSYWSPYYWW